MVDKYWYPIFGSEEFRTAVAENIQNKYPKVASTIAESQENPKNVGLRKKADNFVLNLVKENIEKDPKSILLPYLSLSRDTIEDKFGLGYLFQKSLLVTQAPEAVKIAEGYIENKPELSNAILKYTLYMASHNSLDQEYKNQILNASLHDALTIVKAYRGKNDEVTLGAINIGNGNHMVDFIPSNRAKVTGENTYKLFKEALEVAEEWKDKKPASSFEILKSLTWCGQMCDNQSLHAYSQDKWAGMVSKIKMLDSHLEKTYPEKPELAAVFASSVKEPNAAKITEEKKTGGGFWKKFFSPDGIEGRTR